MKVPFLIPLFLMLPFGIFGQLIEEESTLTKISISDLFIIIQESDDERITLRNLEIHQDDDPFSRFPRNPNYSSPALDSLISTFDPIIIDKPVNLVNCRFVDPILFARIIFKELFYYEFIDGFSNQRWWECRFETRFNAHAIGSFSFKFEHCYFKQFHTEQFVSSFVSFQNCTIDFMSLINDNKQYFGFNECSFQGELFIRLSGESDVLFSQCSFRSTAPDHVLTFFDGSILNSLSFVQDTFDIPVVFQQVSIRESFQVNHSQFGRYLDIHKVNLPENNTLLRWPSIDNARLKVTVNNRSYGSLDEVHDTTETHYFSLLKSYAQLQRIYQNNGDRPSYNASYVEMRNMETEKSKYDYKQSPGIKTFFEWRLNVFLRRFCNYGTSPVKALLYSILVMIIFAIFYFFFPSGENRIRVRALISERKQNQIDSGTFRKLIRQFFNQIMDAVATSMNAFVTLGYGQMPVKGVGKYLAVLEGLIGWFLLSIFSVSLISQILQ